jgi:ABC-2 type transport system permease protein
MQRHNSGLDDWLQHHGLSIGEQLVLDEQNSAFPVPVTRKIGSFRFQEIRMLDYPYFVDLRDDGLNEDNPVTGALNQLSMAWASPISLDEEKTAGLEVTRLLQSSDRAWLSDDLNVMPQIDNRGVSSFRPENERDRYLLGAVLQGRFDSYFADKESPLLQSGAGEPVAAENDAKAEQESVISSIIGHSTESARIVLIASNDFVSDQVIQLSGSAGGTDYLSGLELVNNAVDWAVEDQGLLSIRSRGHFNRSLPPMAQDSHMFWESANYVLAVVMLALLFAFQTYQRRRKNKRYFEKFCV